MLETLKNYPQLIPSVVTSGRVRVPSEQLGATRAPPDGGPGGETGTLNPKVDTQGCVGAGGAFWKHLLGQDSSVPDLLLLLLLSVQTPARASSTT